MFKLKNKMRATSTILALSLIFAAIGGINVSAKTQAAANQSFYEDFEGYSEATFTNSPTILANQYYNGWNMRVQWGTAASITSLNLKPVDTAKAEGSTKNGSTALQMNVELSAVAAPQLVKDPGITVGTEDIIISGDMYLPKVNTGDSRQYARFFISRGLDGATVTADKAEFGLAYTPLMAPAFGLFIDSDNANAWTVKLATPSKIKINDEKGTGIKLTEETWYNLCYIYHPATGEVDYYIDGKKIASHPTGLEHGGLESYYIPDIEVGKALGAVNLVGGGNQNTTDDTAVMFDNVSVVTASAADIAKYGEYENGVDYVFANWDIPVDKTTINNKNITVEKMAEDDAIFSGEGAEVVSGCSLDYTSSSGVGISFARGLTEAYSRYKITVDDMTDIYGNSVKYVYNFVVGDAIVQKGKEYSETFNSADVIDSTTAWTAESTKWGSTDTTNYPVSWVASEDDRSGVLKAQRKTGWKHIDSPKNFNLSVDNATEYVDISFDLKAEIDATEFTIPIVFKDSASGDAWHSGVVVYNKHINPAASNLNYLSTPNGAYDDTNGVWKSYKMRYYPGAGKLEVYMGDTQNELELQFVAEELYTKASGGKNSGDVLKWSTAHGSAITGLVIRPNQDNTTIFLDNVKAASYGYTANTATLKGVSFETASGRVLDKNFAGARVVKLYMDKAETEPIAEISGLGHSGSFDAETGVYTMVLDQMLLGNTNYTLTVDGIPYRFTNADGEYKVSNLKFVDDNGDTVSGKLVNGNVTASVEVFNSTETPETAYLVWAAYNGSELKYIDLKKIDAVGGFDETVEGTALSVSDDITKVKAFILNSLDELVPMLSDVALDKASVSNAGNTSSGEFNIFVGDFDDNGNAKISGSFETAAEGQYVNVMIFAPDKDGNDVTSGVNQNDTIVFADSTYSDENGEFSFDITINGASGEYTAYFGPADNGDIMSVPVYFSDKEENKTKLAELNAMASAVAIDSANGGYSATDVEEFVSFVDSNKDALAFRFALYDDENGVNHTEVAELLIKHLKEQPFDTSNKTAATGVFRTLTVMEGFAENKIKDIDEYSKLLPIFAAEDGVLKEWYSEAEEAEKAELTDRLDESTFGTASEFEEKAVEAAVLARIHYADGEDDVKKVLKDFESYTEISTSGLGLTVYNGLERNSYEDYKALSRAIDNLKKKQSSGSGSGGGGSAGRNTSGNISAVSIENGYLAEEQIVPLESESAGFADVTENDWFYNAVYELVDRGIVSGKTKTEFAPEASITREEIVKMLAVMENLTIDDAEAAFTDVKADDWFYGYVNAAAKAGIVNGIGDGLFGTGQNVTRQDIAVMLFNIATKHGVEPIEETEGEENKSVFADSESISDYAETAVRTLNGLKVINGYDDGSFRPLQFVTRAEAAKLIREFLYINK